MGGGEDEVPPGPAPRIAGYGSLEEIGRGGFAVVYRGLQERFSREVAIKVLSIGEVDDAATRRFNRECNVMGALSWHPHIVVVYDSGIAWGNRPYLVMEYLPNGSLADRVHNGGPLGWEDATRLTIQLAGALETAHSAGVLHRDLKPANAFLDLYGQAKLGDFGIAGIAGTSETTTGHSAFTVVHAAPEVLSGDAATPRSDVYSLGSTLFTLVTGTAAFTRGSDESLAAALMRALRDPVPDLRERGLPDGLAAAVEMAMAKDPSARPDAARFGELLQAVEADHGIAPTDMRLHPGRSAEAGAAASGAEDTTDPTGERIRASLGAVSTGTLPSPAATAPTESGGSDLTVPVDRTPAPAPPPAAQSPSDDATIVGGASPAAPSTAAGSGGAGTVGTVAESTDAPAADGTGATKGRRLPLLIGAAVVLVLLVVGAVVVLGGSGDGGGGGGEAADAGSTDGSGTTTETVGVHEVVSRAITLDQGDAVRILVTPEGDFDPVVTLAAPYDGLSQDDRFKASSFAEPFDVFFTDVEPPVTCDFTDVTGAVDNVDCGSGAVLPGFVSDDAAAGEQELVAAFAPVSGDYQVLVRGAGNSSGSFTLDVETAAPPPDFSIDDFFSDDQVPFYRNYLISERSFFCSDDGLADGTDFTHFASSLAVYCDPDSFDAAFGAS